MFRYLIQPSTLFTATTSPLTALSRTTTDTFASSCCLGESMFHAFLTSMRDAPNPNPPRTRFATKSHFSPPLSLGNTLTVNIAATDSAANVNHHVAVLYHDVGSIITSPPREPDPYRR